jgi:hypothetical protein
MDGKQLFDDVQAWAEAHGIDVRLQPLKPEQAGVFDGMSATLNSEFGVEEQTYYLAHALGSIVRWSLSRDAVQAMFDELRAAKAVGADAARLNRAIDAYRAFEVESSEFAVWLLTNLGHGYAVPPYTNFIRADLEALTEFHRTAQAPVWHDFFSRWNKEVVSGHRHVEPFRPQPIPVFTPVVIEKQEIVQKQG